METSEIKPRMQVENREVRPWQKPQLQRLVVSLDTMEPDKLGSAEDGLVFTRTVGTSVD